MSAPFVCFDIETSGPVPNPYAMLSLGAVALDGDSLEPLGEWYERLSPLYAPTVLKDTDVWSGREDDPVFDAETLRWWDRFPAELAEARRDPLLAREAMDGFVDWVRRTAGGGRAVLLAKPAGFDGMFVNHYAVATGHRFEELPWKHRVMDLASWMVGRLGCAYHGHGRLLPKVPGHDHNALSDARVLAEQFRILSRTDPQATRTVQAPPGPSA